MACSRCSANARLLRAVVRPAQTARFQPIASMIQRRAESTKAGAEKSMKESIENAVKNAPKAPAGTGMMGSYAIYRGTEQIYNTVAEPAKYSISIVDRHNGTVKQLPDGEEVGVSEGPWHKLLDLPPTFSTWSQVTMLRMYLLVARARNLEPDAYEAWYRQISDHFFYDCERLMDVNHGLSAKTVRQRFLKDLFVQWRGVVAAYDEGIARGDAVLASAVWRNLYKARPEGVDFRRVAGVVGYIRASLWDLEKKPDADIVVGKDLFTVPLEGQMKSVEKEIAAAKTGA